MFALRGAFSRFIAADGFFLGAGLAFFVLVTMIPVVLLSVSTLGFVLSSERAASEVVGQLARNFPVYRREIQGAMLRIVETRATTGVIGTLVLVLFPRRSCPARGWSCIDSSASVRRPATCTTCSSTRPWCC